MIKELHIDLTSKNEIVNDFYARSNVIMFENSSLKYINFIHGEEFEGTGPFSFICFDEFKHTSMSYSFTESERRLFREHLKETYFKK